jgi:hypothetical protein
MPLKEIFLTGVPGKAGAGFFVFIAVTIMVLIEGIDKIEDLSWKDGMAM